MGKKLLLAFTILLTPLAGAPALAAARRPEGVTPEIERIIQTGANYLVRTQNRDGSWNNMGGIGGYPTAMTALAGTALLMTGSTPYFRQIKAAAIIVKN